MKNKLTYLISLLAVLIAFIFYQTGHKTTSEYFIILSLDIWLFIISFNDIKKNSDAEEVKFNIFLATNLTYYMTFCFSIIIYIVLNFYYIQKLLNYLNY